MYQSAKLKVCIVFGIAVTGQIVKEEEDLKLLPPAHNYTRLHQVLVTLHLLQGDRCDPGASHQHICCVLIESTISGLDQSQRASDLEQLQVFEPLMRTTYLEEV